jgi:rSAM/selenodomain-associated transferase 1
LLRATVELAVSAWPAGISLFTHPDSDHPLFRELEREFHIRLARQAEGDLGAKMLAALREGIGRGGSAAIMGCDVPHAGWDVIDHANDLLARGRNVLGPSEDGGYYFIGMQEARPELFEDMAWGGDKVREVTLARAEKLDMEFDLLTKLRDVDTASDLWLIAQRYEPLKRFL